ncbi:hypothetical protein V2O64_14515 [Verrucomicrobiaceae bacterium 227]
MVDDGILHAIGTGGVIWSSSDPAHWTVEKTGTTDNLNDLTKGNENLVVVGAAGQILNKGTEGEWMTSASNVNSDLNAVAFATGIFVAVGNGGTILNSRDGINWEPSLKATSVGLSWLRFENGKFIVNSVEGLSFSEDGITWTRQPWNFGAVVWNGNQYIGLRSSYFSAFSNDGVGWDFSMGTTSPGDPRAAVWTGTEIIAVGSGSSAKTSPDGKIWTPVDLGSTRTLTSVIWTGEQAVACESSGQVLFFDSGPPLPAGIVASKILFTGGKVVAACHNGIIAVLGDTTWNIIQTGTTSRLRSIVQAICKPGRSSPPNPEQPPGVDPCSFRKSQGTKGG